MRPREWVRTLELLSLMVLPFQGRTRVLYRALGADASLCETRRYLNLGYWKGAPATLDRACEALVDLVGDTAQIGPEDAVLDVGCGLGDPLVRWVERFSPQRTVGVNLSGEQVEQARRLVAAEGLSGRVEVVTADACHTGLPDASFDVIVGVESAFHFRTRDRFFRHRTEQ